MEDTSEILSVFREPIQARGKEGRVTGCRCTTPRDIWDFRRGGRMVGGWWKDVKARWIKRKRDFPSRGKGELSTEPESSQKAKQGATASQKEG